MENYLEILFTWLMASFVIYFVGSLIAEEPWSRPKSFFAIMVITLIAGLPLTILIIVLAILVTIARTIKNSIYDNKHRDKDKTEGI